MRAKCVGEMEACPAGLLFEGGRGESEACRWGRGVFSEGIVLRGSGERAPSVSEEGRGGSDILYREVVAIQWLQ